MPLLKQTEFYGYGAPSKWTAKFDVKECQPGTIAIADYVATFQTSQTSLHLSVTDCHIPATKVLKIMEITNKDQRKQKVAHYATWPAVQRPWSCIFPSCYLVSQFTVHRFFDPAFSASRFLPPLAVQENLWG